MGKGKLTGMVAHMADSMHDRLRHEVINNPHPKALVIDGSTDLVSLLILD